MKNNKNLIWGLLWLLTIIISFIYFEFLNLTSIQNNTFSKWDNWFSIKHPYETWFNGLNISNSESPSILEESWLNEKYLSTIILDDNTKINIECLEKINWTSSEWDPFLIYRNELELPEYWFGIQYLSPNSCEFDKSKWNWIENWKLNPQWWPVKEYPQRIDFKKIEPCMFTPTEIYLYTGDLTQAIKHFSNKDLTPYKEIKFGEIEDYYGYRYEKLWAKGYLWQSILSWLENGEINLYWRESNWLDSRFVDIETFHFYKILLNKKWTNTIIKFEVFWSDCWWYPQINFLEIL